jgi:hypothetical protein
MLKGGGGVKVEKFSIVDDCLLNSTFIFYFSTSIVKLFSNSSDEKFQGINIWVIFWILSYGHL